MIHFRQVTADPIVTFVRRVRKATIHPVFVLTFVAALFAVTAALTVTEEPDWLPYWELWTVAAIASSVMCVVAMTGNPTAIAIAGGLAISSSLGRGTAVIADHASLLAAHIEPPTTLLPGVLWIGCGVLLFHIWLDKMVEWGVSNVRSRR